MADSQLNTQSADDNSSSNISHAKSLCLFFFRFRVQLLCLGSCTLDRKTDCTKNLNQSTSFEVITSQGIIPNWPKMRNFSNGLIFMQYLH